MNNFGLDCIWLLHVTEIFICSFIAKTKLTELLDHSKLAQADLPAGDVCELRRPAYIISVFLSAVRMQTEKKPLKVFSSLGNFQVDTVWFENTNC